MVYVGIIWVKCKLIISYVEFCCFYGKEECYILLCFIVELLEENIWEICLCGNINCVVNFGIVVKYLLKMIVFILEDDVWKMG